MAAKLDASTQCNFYLLNCPKTSSKAVSVDIKTPVRQKSTQTPTPRSGATTTSVRSAGQSAATGTATSSPSAPRPAGFPVACKSVHVQCKPDLRSSGTQTSPPDLTSVATQCGQFDSKATCIEQAIYVLKSVADFWNVVYEVITDFSQCQQLVVSRHDLVGLYAHGVEPIRVTLDQSGVCSVNRLFVKQTVVSLLKDETELDIDRFMDLLRPLCSESLTLCPGVDEQLVESSSSQGVVSTKLPFIRYQSKKCSVWFEKKDKSKTDVCIHCKYLTRCMLKSRKRKSVETPRKKFKRRQLSSNYSFRKLTPTSKMIRLQRLKRARHYGRQKITRLEKIIQEKEMVLNEDQSLEMRTIIQTINKDHRKDLEAALESTDDENRKHTLQQIWDRDMEKAAFLKDQSKCKTGEKNNRWSSVTYRIALAVYCRSPAAYNALKSFQILQLPSVRSLQTKTSKFLDNPGVNQAYIKEQAKYYEQFRKDKLDTGHKEPCGEGVLIFDEVKVIDKIMWNSKNHEFIGLAMTADDFAYLNDIFLPDAKSTTESSEPTAAKYMLQFVWRDLTSDFDVIGPYFSSVRSLEHKFILGCVLETMRVFHAYDFKVKCLVCDGASENLAVIKTTMNHKGVFGYKVRGENIPDFSLEPSFQNPFLPDYRCYWVVCPSHQLKNMISALHSSREKGAKQFSRRGHEFGWDQIKNLKSREDKRVTQGQVRFVPGLTEAYIARDSWTRLNVKPSKIMQQEALLSELYEHSEENHDDSASSLETYEYLRACNQLFENGFLSKQKVENVDSESIQSVLKGYQFFENWVTELVQENPEYNPNSGRQTKFLAWQTWDLLRICVFGTRGLVEDFLQHHPDYFLVLSRINGSVVESLFSQFKYATGSKLSSVNYAQARKSVIMKANVQSSHPSNTDYRNVPLHIHEQDL